MKLQYAGKEVSLKELEVEIWKVYGEEIKKYAQKRFEEEAPSLIRSELERQLKLPSEKRLQSLNNCLYMEANRIYKAERRWEASISTPRELHTIKPILATIAKIPKGIITTTRDGRLTYKTDNGETNNQRNND